MKVRRDAKLKSLAIPRQIEVARVIEETGVTPASLERLKEIGIEVGSIATLSRFWAWYQDPMQRAAREMEAAGSVTEFLLDRARKEQPGLDQEELYRRGQEIFAQLAIATRDPKIWLATQSIHRDRERVGLKGKELELAERRFRWETAEMFLKWYEDKRATEIASSGASASEKIERLGQVMFGDLWDAGK